MSSTTDALLPLLTQLTAHLPTMIAWIVAVVFALARWQRHPRVSLLVVLAMAIFFVETLVGVWISAVMPLRLRAGGASIAEMSRVFAVWGSVRALTNAGAWAMVVVALFSARPADRLDDRARRPLG